MRRNNKQVTTYFILFSLLLIGVVYAILQANLQINGTAKIKANTWDIHFNNIQVNENSVSIGENDSAATIDPNNNCKVDFEVTLSIPGDFYEFTIDVINAGTIDGMIGELNKTLTVDGVAVEEVPYYLNYSVTYSDGMDIQNNHKIVANTTETYRVRLEFKTNIEELPSATTISTSLVPQYIQADNSAVLKPNVFVEGTWEQIVNAYKLGALNDLQAAMEAGATRNVDLGTFGVHPVRIANLSKPAKCSAEGFSQTACGFVIEFADIITTHEMNSSNVGGWPTSSMSTYVNTDIFNALPTFLKNIIINTVVVSGHGSTSGETNFSSLDKMYLLSTHEIWEDVDGVTTNGISCYDTTYFKTRQLDYYAFLDVSVGVYDSSTRIHDGNYAGAIKQRNGFNSSWWLRSAHSNVTYSFFYVNNNGDFDGIIASMDYGVSPAFRIAE